MVMMIVMMSLRCYNRLGSVVLSLKMDTPFVVRWEREKSMMLKVTPSVSFHINEPLPVDFFDIDKIGFPRLT